MSSDDILSHGVTINLANWARYSASQNKQVADLVVGICDQIRDNDECLITRGFVRQAFAQTYTKGVIASVIWGYPKGRFPGGRSFEGIFAKADALADNLMTLKSGPATDAADICACFEAFPGLGPSTYTKMLYFSGIVATEGPCLIYDQMVMRAIYESVDPHWAAIRAVLGPCRYPNGRFRMYPRGLQIGTYGEYLRAAHGHSNERQSADSIELELFMNAPRGRPTQHRRG